MANRNKKKFTKLMISFVLFTGIIGSSMIVAFASDDISSLLTNWFHDKTDTLIGEVDEEIEAETKMQEERLEEEITAMIADAEQDLEQFTHEEKEKRAEQIETYADELINDFEVDSESDQDELINGLEEILTDAKLEMDHLADQHVTNNSNDE